MKNSNPKIGETLLEALIEIVLAVICFGIGTLVLNLFGVGFSLWEVDPDRIILIGVFAFLFVLALVCIIVQWAKSIAKGKQSSNKSDDCQSTKTQK